MRRQCLPAEYKPRVVTVAGISEADSKAAEEELREAAAKDVTDGCWGYFPALAGTQGIDTDLPAAKRLAGHTPYIMIDDIKLQFNFLRYANRPQFARAPFHLDTDAKTAVTGDANTLRSRQVWRLLINLGPWVRRLSYLDVDSTAVPWDTSEGTTVRYFGSTKRYERSIDLAPRSGSEVQAAFFRTDKVFHRGNDQSGRGHFVAGYGLDVHPDIFSKRRIIRL